MRDLDAVVLAGFAKRIYGCFSPFVAKCMALHEGLLLARKCGLDVRIIETDALCVVQSINSRAFIGEGGAIIEDILNMLSLISNWECCFVPREGNSVAHFLASGAFSFQFESAGSQQIPLFEAPHVLAVLI